MRNHLLLATSLLMAACGRASTSPRPVPLSVEEVASGAETRPSVIQPATFEKVKPAAPETLRETEAAPPSDVRIGVVTDKGKRLLKVARHGDLVFVRRGDARVGGLGEASLALDEGADASLPILIETTRAKTLETTRMLVRLAADGDKPGFVAHLAEAPTPAGTNAGEAHACRAHRDGFGGFAVLCRVDTQANAADVLGDDPGAGVTVFHGATTVVRLDLDGREGVETARAVAYNSRGRGVVVRAESSFLPGEPAPTLLLASQARNQPIVPQRFRGCCMMRHPDLL